MNPYLRVSGLDIPTCAGLLGYSPRLLQEWAVGERPFPPSAAAHIASVLGVNAEFLLNPPEESVDVPNIEPAVWFKLRGSAFGSADRELVLLIRQLGIFYEELESARSQVLSGWKVLFAEIKGEVNFQASPREQGRAAAKAFRRLCDLNYGRSGIGELLRGKLRDKGIIVVESPIEESRISGCAFAVGVSDRPAIFVNNHGTTWFRRNYIILHELAHLIFELDSEAATLDFNVFGASKEDELSERRADEFAQEVAAPKEVLAHVAQKHGIAWDAPMAAREFATLVAELHFEPELIVKAAVASDLLDKQRGDSLLALHIAEDLKELTDHALSIMEYIAKADEDPEWLGKRNTTVPTRRLLLPVRYVREVVEACGEGLISLGRAAHLLMISEDLFVERFGMANLLEAE